MHNIVQVLCYNLVLYFDKYCSIPDFHNNVSILFKFKFIPSRIIYFVLEIVQPLAEDVKLQYFSSFLIICIYWHMATKVEHVGIS